MVASPRDQGSLSLLWPVIGLGSVVYIWWSLLYLPPSSDVASRLLLFYQPFVPPLVMLWCWSCAVCQWERSGIRYASCFSVEDAKKMVGHSTLIRMATVLSVLLSLSAALFLHAGIQGHDMVAFGAALLAYLVVILFLFVRKEWFYGETRRFFRLTLGRVLFPQHGVSWADFLLADCLTSLAKNLGDTSRGLCAVGTYGLAVTKADLASVEQTCLEVRWWVPLCLVYPYAIRFVQCVRVYHDTGNRNQLWNALKYLSMFPVVALAAAAPRVDPLIWQATLRPLWIAAALFNTAFSYFWDIERDWEISYFSQISIQGRLFPRPVLATPALYSRGFYIYLMISNLFLRLAWIYKLDDTLRSNATFVLALAVVEVLRRSQWMLVRVEVELRKLQALQPAGADHRDVLAGQMSPKEDAAVREGAQHMLELQESKGGLLQHHKSSHLIPPAVGMNRPIEMI